MVSDFKEEHNRYLRLTKNDFAIATKKYPWLQRQAREFFDMEKEHEGYWTAERFLV